jgi:hypothetical protein
MKMYKIRAWYVDEGPEYALEQETTNLIKHVALLDILKQLDNIVEVYEDGKLLKTIDYSTINKEANDAK